MAGAGYKLFNTGDVLTAQQVNEYLMQQTVMVFASASARTTALSGVLAEGMVSYLQDTNVVEIYTGASWVSLDDPNAIQNSLLTTTGDTIYASAASTPARLGIGTTGQVLTVSAGGLPTWATAGGATDFTLLNTGGTALTGAATITVNITAYTNIYVFVDGASSASASSEMCWRFNGDSGNNYRDNTINWTIGNASYGHNRGDTSLWMFGMMGSTATSTVTGCLQIFGAKSSTGLKPVQFIGAGGTSTGNKAFIGQALYLGTSAITSISIISNTGNFDAGTMYIYGAN